MHTSLHHTAHRPWPLPASPWTWRQSWLDLLFAHWPVDKALLQPLVPAGLTIQEFGGRSWIGVVPFRMAGVMRRPLPDVPGISAFPELNVRLYVEAEGKPGVWFLSLDAMNHLAVWSARRFFHLPYFWADMRLEREGADYVYRSARTQAGSANSAAFAARYRPTGPVYAAAPGSLEQFLTERYCLYAQAPDGRLLRNQVHHAQWALQPASCEIERNSMLDGFGLTQAGAATLLHFSERIDVIVWGAEGVGIENRQHE